MADLLTSPAPAAPLALRPRDAAKALGISPRLLWQLTHDGVIPHVKVGAGKRKCVLYPVAALDDWLRQQSAPVTTTPINANRSAP